MLDNDGNGGVASEEIAWLDPETARTELRSHIETFLHEQSLWVSTCEGETPPTLGLKVPAGLGKTRTALQCLADHGERLLKRGHILFYVPTLDLAVEAEGKFRELQTDLPSMVLRGRDALNPETGRQMCQRSALAKAISGSVPSVTQSLCQRRTPDNEIEEAPCAHDCAYLGQRDIRENCVVFLSHAYLKAHPPLVGDVALRIIDEKFWSELAETRKLHHSQWHFPPDHIENTSLEDTFRRVTGDIEKALYAGHPLITALREAGVSEHDLRTLSQAETDAQPHFQSSPESSDDVITHDLDKFDPKSAESSRKRGQIFDLISASFHLGHTERLSLERPNPKKETHGYLKMHLLHPLPDSAPVIVLDADLDGTIFHRLCPNAKFEQIRVRPQAEIIQVEDRTLSDHTLDLHPNAKQARAKVVQIIKREVLRQNGEGVLVVATKRVLRKFFSDEDLEFSDSPQEPQELHGATIRWFGPRMLGVNDFAHYRSVILIGRMQPNILAVEDGMRALFGDSESPLQFARNSKLSAGKGTVLMRSGKERRGDVQQHIDPRGQAVLSQFREAQSAQTVARLRLMSPNAPKRVIILSNVPLPGLPIDTRVRFDALAADKSNVQISAKYNRLKTAISGPEAKRLEGLRLSAKGLHKDAPQIFASVAAGKNFLAEMDAGEALTLMKSISADLGLPATPMQLSPLRGGRPLQAVVFSERREALQCAASLWPGYKAMTLHWPRAVSDDEEAILEMS
ncbi:hypothetical protein [Celeribacter sp. PS-C1]|uniref:hypothetical protein n=1 Tax=Celeribacter sp. PS-C1 TaxID=2820813 RepID=UPI001CA5D27D|nr:hypothetical protein [Celeribacter sp. PS-C1]MBW6419636.1 hypothetical protein [Celeribacter sp. PS-C1]